MSAPNANLRNAQLINTDFSDSVSDDSVFDDACAFGAVFDSTDLQRARFRNAMLGYYPQPFASFRGADLVIPPFLRGLGRRIYAAILSFWAGVIPPLPMLGRSWL
ncbi:pentapeptide repeat-containing protein [Pontibrevibacter nitratireducens]|uniref:Uncharacterized protein n=1 Tax=Pontivivens nitratireducens TaxID=2758038 RepID=A0A6G7VPW3_9RHOB|nr:hypothetical protein G8E03_09570 [Pontibrevibacter nitratireducens]